MITVNRIGDSITGSVNGEPFGVPYDENTYFNMKNLEQLSLKAETVNAFQYTIEEFKKLIKSDYETVIEHFPYIYYNAGKGTYHLQLKEDVDGKAIVSKHALPKGFVDRIVESVDKSIDFMPLVRAWIRFMRNPNFSQKKAKLFANYINKTYTDMDMVHKLIASGLSDSVARERATRYQTPITQEGLICTYKVSWDITDRFESKTEEPVKMLDKYEAVVNTETGQIIYSRPTEHVEDRVFEPVMMRQRGDEFYCGDTLGHVCRVGERHRLESWDQVNCEDGVVGDKGLHSGNLDYIRGYQSEGTVTHNVFIDPMYIGRFTNDGEGAIVSLDYFIHSSFAGVNRSLYHSSKYAALGDEEYRRMVREAIWEHGELDNSDEETIQEKEALI